MQEYINIGNKILKEYNIQRCNIKFKDVYRGRSTIKGNISIPLWSKQEGKEFIIYYIIHEVIHQIIYRDYKTFKHTKAFKELERKILKEYNIIIKYARAYAKALYNREGKLLYSRD